MREEGRHRDQGYQDQEHRDQGHRELGHRELGRLARDQWQVLSVEQIRGAGFGDDQIWRLTRSGLLHRHHKGIYSYATERLTRKGILLAAQWSVGDDAYLTARTALGLHQVRGLYVGEIDIAVPRRSVRPRGAPIHLTRTSRPPERLQHDGPLRFTHVERALIDLSAQGATVGELKRMITAAVHQRCLNHPVMLQLLTEHAGQRHIHRLIEAYHSYIPDPEAKHRLELSWDKGLLTRPWIPQPQPNVYLTAGGVRWELDRFWPDEKVLVELHGGGHHHADVDLEKDTFKAVKLALIGIQTLPITDTRWELEPGSCLDDLEAMLALRGWAGRPGPSH